MLRKQLVCLHWKYCDFLVESSRKNSAKFDKIKKRGSGVLNSGQQEYKFYRETYAIEELNKKSKAHLLLQIYIEMTLTSRPDKPLNNQDGIH